MTPEEYEQAVNYWIAKEAEARRMPADELRAEVDAFLSGHDVCALACGNGDFVRCTPLEYAWRDGAVWIFSEGGLKFRALAHNDNVSLSVFEPDCGFGKLQSAQITGKAQVVDPMSEEFAAAAAAKGLPAGALDKLRRMLHLIKIEPSRIDYLCSSLKARGYESRQWLDC